MATDPNRLGESLEGAATVRDLQTRPRGVLSQNAKMFLLLGITVVMLIVIVTSGHSTPPAASLPTAAINSAANPARVADYRERLRNLAPGLAPDGTSAPLAPTPIPSSAQDPGDTAADGTSGAPGMNQVAEARAKREYDSLFASNLVLTRRPDTDVLNRTSAVAPSTGTDAPSLPTLPSLDDVAQAVAKATSQVAAPVAQPATPVVPSANAASVPARPVGSHRVFEGTTIDGVLANRLEGSMAGPVNVLVSTPVYAQDLTLVIPAGARVLGTAKQVEALGETRLAVAFHRLVLPNGDDISLDQFVGMNALGDAGLKDKVNNHYLATFGASAAVGMIAGFAQWAGGGFKRNTGSTGGTVVVAGNVSDATSQVTAQAMSRFINRLPTITIREGHRVAVYLTSDLDLPAYRGAR